MKANEIKVELEKIAEELPVKQNSLYPLRRIMKMAFILEELSSEDNACKDYLNILHSDIKNLRHTIIEGTDKEKLLFAKLIETITDYLKINYKVTTENYYTNLFTVIGIFTGLIISTIYLLLFCNNFDLVTVSFIGFVFLLISRTIGNKIDNKQRIKRKQI